METIDSELDDFDSRRSYLEKAVKILFVFIVFHIIGIILEYVKIMGHAQSPLIRFDFKNELFNALLISGIILGLGLLLMILSSMYKRVITTLVIGIITIGLYYVMKVFYIH
tara:strand:- start:722 stop:1054 length:333 start_codon:yes stop_codon:yes gene_type:complete